MFLLLLEPQDAPTTLPDDVSAAAGTTKTLPQHPETVLLLMLEPQDTPAILPEAVSIAAGATGHFCNAPGRCFCS